MLPISAASCALLTAAAFGGSPVIETTAPAPAGGFDSVRRPITNPTLFDLALPTTNIHPIVIYQNLPDFVNTVAGPVPLGGDFQVYALQFEYALSERLSIVATKDGYVDFNPDTALIWSNQSGFANIGAGLKYALIYDPANEFVLSGSGVFEFPTGNHDVFQGEGDGVVNLILTALKMFGPAQLAGGAGVQLPLDSQQSTLGFVSGHFSYEVCKWFIPLVEVNWHHVIDAGSGYPTFASQAGGLVPVIAAFEGGDLLNFGAANSSQNRNLVTAAVGFRSRLTDSIDLGFAYELPLTDNNDSIMDDRFTLDLVWRF